jgi:hypothetical protein
VLPASIGIGFRPRWNFRYPSCERTICSDATKLSTTGVASGSLYDRQKNNLLASGSRVSNTKTRRVDAGRRGVF